RPRDNNQKNRYKTQEDTAILLFWLIHSVSLLPLALLRLAGKIALTAYFLAAILFLGMRYWVLPNIDTWRPQLERQLSAALSTPVTVGHIGADWNGPIPRFDMSDVVL